MFDKHGTKLKNGDLVCITPSYEESLGGQVYQPWYGNITIINNIYYLDDKVLTNETCKNIAVHNPNAKLKDIANDRIRQIKNNPNRPR